MLRLCLEEIDRCRPYFIGLLGDYYGTLARDVAPRLELQDGWPADSADRSVTELEIVHGVLARPEMADHALFYFRDPAYVQRLPAEAGRTLVDSDPDAVRKLAALKGRPIRNWTLDERGLDGLLIFDGRPLRLEGRSQVLLGGPWRPLPVAQRLTLQHRLARAEFLARSGGFRLNP